MLRVLIFLTLFSCSKVFETTGFNADSARLTISGVNTSKPDGSYVYGETMSIVLTFSEAITVIGTPELELNSFEGSIPCTAGPGANELTCNYTVKDGHNTLDLDIAGTDALKLPLGSSIKNSQGVDADLTLYTPGSTGSVSNLKAIDITTADPNPNNEIWYIYPSRKFIGRYYLLGDFTTYGNETTSGIIRVFKDLTYDESFNSAGAGFDAVAKAIREDIDGSGDLIIGGLFTTYNAIGAPGAIRLNSDGSIDNSFNSGTGFNSGILEILQDKSGDLFFTGPFTDYDSNTTNHMAKMDRTGVIDGTFDVLSIWGTSTARWTNKSMFDVDGSGTIYVAGYVAPSLNKCATIDSTTGSLVAGYSTAEAPNNWMGEAIADIYNHGNMICAGQGSYNPGSGTRNYVLKYSKTGVFDSATNPSAPAMANAYAHRVMHSVYADGQFYIAGPFTIVRGNAVSGIARLNYADFSHDNTWNTGAGPAGGSGDVVMNMTQAIDGSGRVYAVGNFTTWDGDATRAGITWVDTITTGSSPIVKNVTSTNANGSYITGQVITIELEFDLAVAVTGNPRVLMDVGTLAQYAIYTSGSGGKKLYFSYTIGAGDASPDLDVTSEWSLELNGGTIVDTINGNPATVVLPIEGWSNSLKSNKNLDIN